MTLLKTLLCCQLTRWLTALRKRWCSSGVQISRGRFPLEPFCMSPESEPSEAASLRGDRWGPARLLLRRLLLLKRQLLLLCLAFLWQLQLLRRLLLPCRQQRT